MTALIGETRYALRRVRRSKGFAFAVILSTALGVGMTASIFSLIDAFLLRPLPVPDTGRIVRLTAVTQSSSIGRFSYLESIEINERVRAVAGTATSQNAVFGFARTADEQPRVTIGLLVNGDFFSTLNVRPVLGRTFTTEEDRVSGRNPVVVLSYRMWRQEFGGQLDVIGRSLRLNAHEFTIIGIAPEWFVGVPPLPSARALRSTHNDSRGHGIAGQRAYRSYDSVTRHLRTVETGCLHGAST